MKLKLLKLLLFLSALFIVVAPVLAVDEGGGGSCALPDSYMLCASGALSTREQCYNNASTQYDNCTGNCSSSTCLGACYGALVGSQWICDIAHSSNIGVCECRYCGCW